MTQDVVDCVDSEVAPVRRRRRKSGLGIKNSEEGRRLVRELAPDAIQVLKDVLGGEKVTKMRFDAAKDVLDRCGVVGVKEIQINDTKRIELIALNRQLAERAVKIEPSIGDGVIDAEVVRERIAGGTVQ